MNFTFAMAFRVGQAPGGPELWRTINDGPPLLRPTSVGNFEPLRKVETVNLDEVCSHAYIWRNGQKCLGIFEPNGWRGKQTLAILLQYPAVQHVDVTAQVHEFIKSRFAYRLLYGVSPTEELMSRDLDLHQVANCGAIPPDERVITENRDLLEFFESDA